MTYQLSKTEQDAMRRALLRGTRSKGMYPYPQPDRRDSRVVEIEILNEHIRKLEQQRIWMFGIFCIVVGLLMLFR